MLEGVLGFGLGGLGSTEGCVFRGLRDTQEGTIRRRRGARLYR